MTDVAAYPVEVLPSDPSEQAAQIAEATPDGSIQFTWRGLVLEVPPLLAWPAQTLRWMEDPTKHAYGLLSAVLGEEAYTKAEALAKNLGDLVSQEDGQDSLIKALERAIGTKPGEAAASAVS